MNLIYFTLLYFVFSLLSINYADIFLASMVLDDFVSEGLKNLVTVYREIFTASSKSIDLLVWKT
jgi:hypothetical protein